MQQSYTKVDRWLYVLYLLLSTTFYFLTELPRIVPIGLAGLCLVFIIARRRLRFRAVFVPMAAFLILIHLAKFNPDHPVTLLEAIYPWSIIHLIFFFYLSSEGEVMLKAIYKSYLSIFLLMQIPALILWFGMFVGLPIPYKLVHLGGRDLWYRNYMGLAIIDDFTVVRMGRFTFGRMCGIFEEPGMLGTYAAVFLIASSLLFPRSLKIMKILLVTLGVFSLSLAFYVGFAMWLLWSGIKARSKGLIVATSVAIIFVALLPTLVGDIFGNFLFRRLHWSGDSFEGDTRSQVYASVFRDYVNQSSSLDLAFGHGANSDLSFASYQQIIHDGGYIGILIVICFMGYFFVVLPVRQRRYLDLLVTLFPLLSIYQRPDTVGTYMLLMYAVVLIVYVSKGDDMALHAGLFEETIPASNPHLA